MRYLKEHGTTVLVTSENTELSPDDDLQYVTDGTIELERAEAGRTVSVPKFRGSSICIRERSHSMRIGAGGIEIHPELEPSGGGCEFTAEPLPSGRPRDGRTAPRRAGARDGHGDQRADRRRRSDHLRRREDDRCGRCDSVRLGVRRRHDGRDGDPHRLERVRVGRVARGSGDRLRRRR